MSNEFLFGISLTTSFFAGILALFAPCCITFLLPSYLGTIFKKTEKVFFYTLIFAAGLSAVLVPVALGFRLIVSFFDQYHGFFYYLGAVVLIVMGLMTLVEMKMPFSLGIRQKPTERVDIVSVFTLGIVSGLTSSCCAPVLFAAITLTSLSPTLLQALIVAFSYVLGIVFPLFLLSFFYEKISQKAVMQYKSRAYQIFKILGGTIFILTGVAIAILNFQGKIVMYQNEGFNKTIRLLIFGISKYFQNPIIDIAAFLIILFIFYKLITRKQKGGDKKNETQ